MNPLIIKLGGVLLDSEEALERLFSALVNYRESHQRPLVIVHGGGCVVDELMKGLNLPVEKEKWPAGDASGSDKHYHRSTGGNGK
ncbi:acetylglutamate kinase [Escherichia coli]|nr:acetylglutamate kinase [Escherichia coli]